ncbi:N-glycosylase/DNA lyase [Methanomicrobium sp. W14]|uniref:DNA-3-methyladenine glycosylase family protein n=1 Tax=Methanomicrobium sp. W14 TaxID=2817839 RepID=UPI001AEAF7E4|nr:DNA glycosylase [Methanomicrobium sp. W14]MBP2133469.1 N-glycosylase/DNA lyase [Methanomicrobium sp. W14]
MDGYRSMEIHAECPFNLNKTLSLGQAPRWAYNRKTGWWYGVVKDSVIKIRQDGNILYFSGCSEKFCREYFSLEYDIKGFYNHFPDDPNMKKAIEKNYGLRITVQDPWECLCFQLSVNKKRVIPKVDSFTRISNKLGEPIELDDMTFHTYPSAANILEKGISALKSCNIGYKAKNIYLAAEKTSEDPLWTNRILNMSNNDAISYLCNFKGIKPNVAEWILLFSFKCYSVFPVDSHIRKYFFETYLSGLPPVKIFDATTDRIIKNNARDYFGEYSGYALEYLFAERLRQKRFFKIT